MFFNYKSFQEDPIKYLFYISLLVVGFLFLRNEKMHIEAKTLCEEEKLIQLGKIKMLEERIEVRNNYIKTIDSLYTTFVTRVEMLEKINKKQELNKHK